MAAELVVGESFSSYKELDAKIRSYQKDKFVQLSKRDSRTLEMAKKRIPKRVHRYYKLLVSMACRRCMPT